MKRLQTLLLMLTFLTLFGCEDFGQSAKIGEPFKLKMNESAKVGGAGIVITVIRIGRKWLANGGGESLDFNFSVKHDGKVEIYSAYLPVPDLITAGEYKIEVVKTEPFGEGYAIFVVTKNDAVKNNEVTKNGCENKIQPTKLPRNSSRSFGWHIDESIPPTKMPIEFPKNFDGLPFYHYQSVSERSGVDMTPLLGKTTRDAEIYAQRKAKRSRNGISDFRAFDYRKRKSYRRVANRFIGK